MNRLALLAAAALLAGCDTPFAADSFSPVAAPPSVMVEADMNMKGELASASTQEATQSFLAYRYGYDFTLPQSAVEPTMQAHMKRCQTAGPAQCQILASNVSTYGDDTVGASLSFRAQPDWLSGFKDEMIESVTGSGGKLTGSNTSVEDLTRSILDTDARLGAQRALRMRLQTLLETKSAKLSELLEVERELARVQGEIESATATLKVLRARVEMSRVDVNYRTKYNAVGGNAFAPVTDALSEFVGTVSIGLGGVIMAVAFLLPWFLFIGLPLIWFIRRWRRKKRADAKRPDIVTVEKPA